MSGLICQLKLKEKVFLKAPDGTIIEIVLVRIASKNVAAIVIKAPKDFKIQMEPRLQKEHFKKARMEFFNQSAKGETSNG